MPATPCSVGSLPSLDLLYQLHALGKVQELAGNPQELKQAIESVSVPAETVGWVRLRWRSESEGRQMLEVVLWFDSKDSGRQIRHPCRRSMHLQVLLRARPKLAPRPLNLVSRRDDSLDVGVTGHIICWSSTRTSLNLQAKDSRGQYQPDRDPFVVGEPERLSLRRRGSWRRRTREQGDFIYEGRWLCAYRIPVTVLPVSKDVRIFLFDIGLFRLSTLPAEQPGHPG